METVPSTVEVVLETAVCSLNTVVLDPASKTDETLIVVELDLDKKVKLEQAEAHRQRHEAKQWQRHRGDAKKRLTVSATRPSIGRVVATKVTVSATRPNETRLTVSAARTRGGEMNAVGEWISARKCWPFAGWTHAANGRQPLGTGKTLGARTLSLSLSPFSLSSPPWNGSKC